MSGYGDLSLRPQSRRYAQTMAAIGVLAAVVAVVPALCGVGLPLVWGIVAVVGLLFSALFGSWLRRRLDAGSDGLRMRRFLRWRRLAWADITGFAQVEKSYPRGGVVRRIEAGRRGRRPVALALPYDGPAGADSDMESTLARLRALHRQYAPDTAPASPVPDSGRRESGRARFVRTRAAPLTLCVVAAATAGYFAVQGVAGLCFALLAVGGLAGYWLTRRGRSGEPVGPGDQAEPSGLAFLLPIGWTAVWAVPLAGLRPSTPVAVGVAVGGGVVTLVLAALALRVSGRRLGEEVRDLPVGEDVYLPAAFLDHGPQLGMYIVLGAGPPAVVPHAGPGRFAAKEIPAERYTVLGMRRPREGEHVSAGWYVADLLDGDDHVRLAARPGNLMLLLRGLEAAGAARAPSEAVAGETAE